MDDSCLILLDMHESCIYHMIVGYEWVISAEMDVSCLTYGVAKISRPLEIIGLFYRISSVLQGSFAKETYNFKEPTNRSHPVPSTGVHPNKRVTWLIHMCSLICDMTHSHVKHTVDAGVHPNKRTPVRKFNRHFLFLRVRAQDLRCEKSSEVSFLGIKSADIFDGELLAASRLWRILCRKFCSTQFFKNPQKSAV